MSSSLRIIICDPDQRSSEQITASLKRLGTHADLLYVEDQDGLIKHIGQVNPTIIVYKKAEDFDYVFALRKAKDVKSHHIPVILLIDDIQAFSDNSSSSIIHQATSAGACGIVHALNFDHLASSIQLQYNKQLLEAQIIELKRDVSEAKEREHNLLAKSEQAVAFIKEGAHVFANNHYADLFNVKDANELIGFPFIDLIHNDARAGTKTLLKAFAKDNYTTSNLECAALTTQGSTFKAKLNFTPAEYESERCTQVVISREKNTDTTPNQTTTVQVVISPDTSENGKVSKTQQMLALKTHPISVLGNEIALKETLNNKYISKAIKDFVLTIISLDNSAQMQSLKFSDLRKITKEFTELLTKSYTFETCFQIGDLLFAVFESNTLEHTKKKADAFRAIVEQYSFSLSKKVLSTTVSIGISKHYSTMTSSEDILESAYETAVKVSQDKGNAVAVYSSQSIEKIVDDPANPIRDAIIGNKFTLKFQHIYDTFDDEAQFFEVFLRLKIDDNSVLKPGSFLAIANDLGLNGELDKWVMMNACKQLKTYQSEHPNTKILINMTSASLKDSSTVQLVKKLLNAIGRAFAQSLVFQFNETSLIEAGNEASAIITEIKSFGCKCSMTNFKGASKSFDVFNYMTLDMVKLDQSVITDWNDEAHIEKLKDIVNRLNELGKETILPFIDNPTSMAKAWTVGAKYLQGYFLHSPSDQLQPHAEH